MAGPSSSYSTLYQEGRLYLFFSNLKHQFSGWYTVWLQFRNKCFSYFPRLLIFSGCAPLTGINDFIMVTIYLGYTSISFNCAASLERSAVIICFICSCGDVWHHIFWRPRVVLPVPRHSGDMMLSPLLLEYQLRWLYLGCWMRGQNLSLGQCGWCWPHSRTRFMWWSLLSTLFTFHRGL